MHNPRAYNAATTLLDGRVLVTGGETLYRADYAESYDPATGNWSVTGPMHLVHDTIHTATLLADGRVLLFDGSASIPPEIYDPATDTWTPTGLPNRGHFLSTAVRLPDGRVLVFGGIWSDKTAEIFDPMTNAWSYAAPTSMSLDRPASVLLPTGKVLVLHGWDSFAGISSELYDPTTDTWSKAAAPSSAMYPPLLILLPNGKVLTIYSDGTELYDPLTDTWSKAAPPPASLSEFQAVRLETGHVLVAGGVNMDLPAPGLPVRELGRLPLRSRGQYLDDRRTAAQGAPRVRTRQPERRRRDCRGRLQAGSHLRDHLGHGREVPVEFDRASVRARVRLCERLLRGQRLL
jgi:hypothetical protein